MTYLTTQSTKIDVAAAAMSELVKFYNDLTGKSIKKFETRAVGVARCVALLKDVPPPQRDAAEQAAVRSVARKTPEHVKAARRSGPGVVIAKTPDGAEVRKVVRGRAPTAMDQMVATVAAKPAEKRRAPTKVAAAPAKKTPTKKPSGSAPRISEDSVITILHKGENPKRGTAAERYALYRTGMTVAAYIAAGGQRRDVLWDSKCGWIKVGGA